MAAHAVMDGRPFVEQLKTEMEMHLRKLIDAPLATAGASEASVLSPLLKMALKNEMEAAEVAAEWVETTPELEARLALAQHAGDEARHYQLLAEKIQGLGVSLEGFDPLVPPSPVLTYLR